MPEHVLIPQFTIRRMLLGMVLAAGVCLVLAWASQGVTWAIGVSLALLCLTAMFTSYVAIFGLVWMFSLSGYERPQAFELPAEPVGTPVMSRDASGATNLVAKAAPSAGSPPDVGSPPLAPPVTGEAEGKG